MMINMKTFKKIIGILSLFSLLFMLAACGPHEDSEQNSSEEQAGNKESDYDLLVWEDVEKTAGIENAIEQFEEENEVKMKVEEETDDQQIEKIKLTGTA